MVHTNNTLSRTPEYMQMQTLSDLKFHIIFLQQRKFQRFPTLIKSALRYLEKGNCRYGGLMALESIVKLLQMKRCRMPSKRHCLLKLKILISPLSWGDGIKHDELEQHGLPQSILHLSDLFVHIPRNTYRLWLRHDGVSFLIRATYCLFSAKSNLNQVRI